MASILIIDDEDNYASLCQRYIPEHSYLGPARNWREAARILGRVDNGLVELDLILLDVHFDIAEEELVELEEPVELEKLRRRQGFAILQRIRQRHPHLPVIVMTSAEDVPLDVDAHRLEAHDYTYLLDDEYLDARSVRQRIAAALWAGESAEQNGYYWGRSSEMQAIRRRVALLARGQLPMLIQGPTGVGKSFLARNIVHAASERDGPFVAVDLSTVPRDLVSAHLFGAVKGAFTGAVHSRDGVFAEADGGTLFLDEIGNLSVALQKSLLQVLQERSFRPLGSVQERKFDIKIVAATNEDLAHRVAAGDFREDLYMRLNPATKVELPGLDRRSDDWHDMLRHFVRRVAAESYNSELITRYLEQSGLERGPDGDLMVDLVVGPKLPVMQAGVLQFMIHPASLALLRASRWPGNFRQLEMVLSNTMMSMLVELLELDGSGSAFAGRGGVSSPRSDLLPFPAKLLADLASPVGVTADPGRSQSDADSPSTSDVDTAPPNTTRVEVDIEAASSLNRVSQSVERQYMRALFTAHGGDLQRMSRVLLGTDSGGRKVALRLNKLGLSVKQLRRVHDDD